MIFYMLRLDMYEELVDFAIAFPDYRDYIMDIESTGNVFMAYPEENMDLDVWEWGKKQNLDVLPYLTMSFDFVDRLAVPEGESPEGYYLLNIDKVNQINALSEDIAMDVFAWLIVHKTRYNFSVSLKTYLFMLVRSRALDHIKHRSKLQTVELSEAAEQAHQGLSLEEQLLADERKRAVYRALESLDADMRLAVHLVYFEEMSADEAAKVLKKNRKQVYNLLYRGKNALRTILGEEGELFL